MGFTMVPMREPNEDSHPLSTHPRGVSDPSPELPVSVSARPWRSTDLRVPTWPKSFSESRWRIAANFAVAALFIAAFLSIAFWDGLSSSSDPRERLAGRWRMDVSGARMRAEDRDAFPAVREELEIDRGLTIDLDRDGELFFRWGDDPSGGPGNLPSYSYDVDGEELIFKLGEGREVRYGYAIETPDRMTLKLRLLGHDVAVPCYCVRG